MIHFISGFLAFVNAFFSSRYHLGREILALRQQLGVLKRKNPRPGIVKLTQNGTRPSPGIPATESAFHGVGACTLRCPSLGSHSFEALGGPYTKNALQYHILDHSRLFGRLRKSCVGNAQSQGRFHIPCCALGNMAAYGNSFRAGCIDVCPRCDLTSNSPVPTFPRIRTSGHLERTELFPAIHSDAFSRESANTHEDSYRPFVTSYDREELNDRWN